MIFKLTLSLFCILLPMGLFYNYVQPKGLMEWGLFIGMFIIFALGIKWIIDEDLWVVVD